jgi:Uma2 family endonuclease
MNTAALLPSEHVVLDRISWRTFLSFLEDCGEHRRGRITYDRGTLEIMTLSSLHESWKRFVGRLIGAYADEAGLEIKEFGSFTFKLERLERGLEPDECFYIANEALVRNRDEIDLEKDPSPDLVVEVDISRSSLDRMSIYAAFRVPEVWRFDGKALRAYRLNRRGSYSEVAVSRALPGLAMSDLQRFLRRRGGASDSQVVRAFKAWVRARATKG